MSGKGIAGALTMASLEASSRAEAMRAGDDLGGLIARVNNMVYDVSTADRYATRFDAQFDPDSRRLSYVMQGTARQFFGVLPKDAIQWVIQAADAFASGAPQSDDMTLVVLRVQSCLGPGDQRGSAFL